MWTAVDRPARAQSLQSLFAGANQAYFRGDHKTALARYERLIAAGVRDADVYFNLATIHAKAGSYGRAILFFERSMRLGPGDEQAERGLAASHAALGRRRAESAGEATVRTRPSMGTAMVRPVSENSLALSVLVLEVAFFAVLAALGITRRETPRVALGVAAPLLGLCLLVSALGLATKADAWSQGRRAVVLREQAEVREGPDPRAQARARVPEGRYVRVVERDNGFVRVRMPGEIEGWMKRGDVGDI
ncbi:MAG: SH3 domain-containing protein [Proteobacteria bacterium]|nr:SH3 domain-containing protein [Pseudomonadota bacterium]